VFGFLKRLFRRRKSVEKLRSAWAANRTPAVAEDLARALLDRGDVDEALRLLKEAYRLFPRAERIRSYYHHTLRRKSSQEIRSLRRAIATNGRAEIYARLAELYRYLGHFEEAIEVAREGIEKYPEFSGNHLAIGRIHYTRFLKTSSAHDGRQAAECLQKAFELDPQNFKTLFHLANLYLTVGDRNRAREYLESLAKLVPGDSRINDLWERLHSIPEDSDIRAVDYFTRYETARLGGLRTEREEPTPIEVTEEFRKKLEELAAVRGVNGIYVVDPWGGEITTVAGDGDPEETRAAVTTMFEGARLNSRRMSIGTFTRAVISCNRIKIFLYDLEGNGLAALGDAALREDLVHRKVAAVAEECFCET